MQMVRCILTGSNDDIPRITKKQPPGEVAAGSEGDERADAAESILHTLDLRLRKLVGNIAKTAGNMGNNSGKGEGSWKLTRTARDLIMKELSSAKAGTLSAARHGHGVRGESDSGEDPVGHSACAGAVVENTNGRNEFDASVQCLRRRVGVDVDYFVRVFRDKFLKRLFEMAPTATIRATAVTSAVAAVRERHAIGLEAIAGGPDDSTLCEQLCNAIRLTFEDL